MLSNTPKVAMQVAPTAPSLSKREKAALMTGQKVNLFVKKELLFQLPRKLLEHYSLTWKYQLGEQQLPVLYMNNYHKDAIKYVTQWMVAGGKDSSVKGAIPYPKDDSPDLVCLNKLAAELGIRPLQERTFESIDNYTRHHPMPLMVMERVVSMAGIPVETRDMISTNLKKWIGSRADGEWVKQGEQHPQAFEGAMSLLAVVRKEVAQAEEARRKARLSREHRQSIKAKSTNNVAPTGGNTSATVRVAKGKGPRKEGRSASKKPNNLAYSGKNNIEAKPASKPLDSADATKGMRARNAKATKASAYCFNCGQADHTRPYCSNPRAFIGKCYTCDQQGHRAADCPSKTKADPKVETEVKFQAKASLNKEGTNKAVPAHAKGMVGQKSHHSKGEKTNGKEAQVSFPPLVAKIVFVKDVGRASNIDNSAKGAPHRSTSAQSSSATDGSSRSQQSADSPPTSPGTEASPHKLAEQEHQPKVHRFITKKVRALNITSDGSVQREMVPGFQEKKKRST